MKHEGVKRTTSVANPNQRLPLTFCGVWVCSKWWPEMYTFPNPWLLEIPKSGKYHTESLLQEVLLSVALKVLCKFGSWHSKLFQGKVFWRTSISGWVHAPCYLAFRQRPPWDLLLFLGRKEDYRNCPFRYVCSTKHQQRSVSHLYYHELLFLSQIFCHPQVFSPPFASFKTLYLHSNSIPVNMTELYQNGSCGTLR